MDRAPIFDNTGLPVDRWYQMADPPADYEIADEAFLNQEIAPPPDDEVVPDAILIFGDLALQAAVAPRAEFAGWLDRRVKQEIALSPDDIDGKRAD